MRDFTGLLKLAGVEHRFTVGDSAGLATKSRDTEFTGLGLKAIESDAFEGESTIRRIRKSDGSIKYRVVREFPTEFKDSAGRKIPQVFSAEVDSPFAAMRLARGNARFSDATKILMDRVTSSNKGVLKDSGIRDFSVETLPGLAKRGPYYAFRKLKPVKEPLNYVKVLKRLAALHPRAVKALLASAAAVKLGIGASVLMAARKNRNNANVNAGANVRNGIPMNALSFMAGGAASAGLISAISRKRKKRRKDRKGGK